MLRIFKRYLIFIEHYTTVLDKNQTEVSVIIMIVRLWSKIETFQGARTAGETENSLFSISAAKNQR